MNVYPVIMCGGVGSRLWPLSTAAAPKQFLPLFEGLSPFQQTVKRLAPLQGARRLVVVAGAAHEELLRAELAAIGADAWLILEPAPRDSAAAIAAAALAVTAVDPTGVLAIVSSDNHVADQAAFLAAIRTASLDAAEGRIVTLGLVPRTASPAWGYILPGPGEGPVLPVRRFVEKPTPEVARSYLAEGYLWNSGNFIAPAELLISQLEILAPQTLGAVRGAMPDLGDASVPIRLGPEFAQASRISIDYALMEKTALAAVLPVAFDLVDIGSWKSVWEVSPKDPQGNVIIGEVTTIDTRDVYARSDGGMKLAVVGVDGVAVIIKDDRVLVCGLDNSQLVKRIADLSEDPA